MINLEDPGISFIKELMEKSSSTIEILPPSNQNEKILLSLQVTTYSTLGAIAYDTGGILVQNGWLRILGSGNHKIKHTLMMTSPTTDGFILIAHDAVGGFFALNSGKLGNDPGKVYYFAPDSLDWEPLNIGYTAFIEWSFSENLNKFYQDLRWNSWQEESKEMNSNQAYSFSPPLWTKEGSIENSNRQAIKIDELWSIRKQ